MYSSYKWQGHKAPVSCLDLSSNLLLSGSEDRTARLWDVRDSRRRAGLCISTLAEIFCVKFAPPSPTKSQMDLEFPNPFAKDHTIYLSMEHVVLEYDLRMATGPIISSPTRDLSNQLQNQDEINAISAVYFQKPKQRGKGKAKTNIDSEPKLYIASADDAGTVRLMDVESEQSHILHHDPNGVAVVPSCAFRPGSTKTLELASGGTDCKIHLWDVMKPKRALASFTMQQPDSGDASKPQVCNPPMVHSLSWSASGKLLAAGLGDGNIPIFSVENRSLVQTGFLPEGHDSSVASVVFPSFMQANERLLISGGTDGTILCWDIGTNVMELSDATDPSEMFEDGFLNVSTDSSNMNQISKQVEQLNIGNPKILFGIPHIAKVNWMVTSSDNSIFVADTYMDITEYKLPLR